MALGKRHSMSSFITTFFWILFLVLQQYNLVICDRLSDDSLKNALKAIERRQRDLEFQENDFYGQPENIGYGFQKTLGFFDDSGPATDLGSFDSRPKSDADLQNLLMNYEGDADKRKSSFRERMGKNYLIDRGEDEGTSNGVEYLQLLRNLWSKYRESRPEEVNPEDLTDEEVEEILNMLYEKPGEEGAESLEMIPVRSRKNYRVFDDFADRRKRYPSFGEGMYGKRNLHYQNLNYENPENEFLYSLKFVNPELNREAVENLREDELLGDEKDKDVMRLLNNALTRPKYVEEDEPFWVRNQNNYEEEDGWLPGPVTFLDDGYEGTSRNEKREKMTPRFFKNHNGIRLNAKRFPVKRSTIRVRKEAKTEKASKELKGIFATSEPNSDKKASTKKPTETVKKLNVTKPEVTKHRDTKKVVRRAEYTKEEVFPMTKNEEIVDIFNVDKKNKKSIDWSQYFGLDKRSRENWIGADYLRRAEGHLAGFNKDKFSGSPGQYEMPFDTRTFNRKRFSYDLGANLEKVENKIGDVEEKIIDDTVKYTGAHSGGGGGEGEGKEDTSQVKDKVIQRLEAAYSLEKMRNALEEFKNLMKPGEKGKDTSTEGPKTEAKTSVPKESSNLEKPMSDKGPTRESRKRIANKKEGVKNLLSPELSENVEFLNDVYGRKPFESEDCPVLDKILHNCLRLEEMGGRHAELLVPLCSLQQICYFCGPEIGFSKMSTCDSMYLSEAQNICQGESECLVNARRSMFALQDLYEQEFLGEGGDRLLSGSCLANPCVQRYFLSAPGAIYPLELQK